MAWESGPVYLASGEERIFDYWEDPSLAYAGQRVATISPSGTGGPYLITGQGLRNVANPPDQLIKYTLRVRNGGGSGVFRFVVGKLA
jgi:TRAP-type uncharacterized transport system substrate-binding protein